MGQDLILKEEAETDGWEVYHPIPGSPGTSPTTAAPPNM